jgi:hypothetical protein
MSKAAPQPKKQAKKTTAKKAPAKKRRPRTPPVIAAVKRSLPPPAPIEIEIEGTDGLTDKQRVFVEQYLMCWNATEAARRAGYSDANQSAYDNKLNLAVKAAIDARLKEHHMSADEVLARLSDHAQGSMDDFVSEAKIAQYEVSLDAIDLGKARRAGKLHLVKRLSITDKGTSIELYAADHALELLGKHYELFTEKQRIEGEVNARITNLNELMRIAYGPKPDPTPSS